jgi:hypothetical protein
MPLGNMMPFGPGLSEAHGHDARTMSVPGYFKQGIHPLPAPGQKFLYRMLI